MSVSATNQNRLSGFGYDAAGNMTSNTPNTYIYNAENQLVWTNSSPSYRYVYDGHGNRVEKCQAATATTACPTSGTTGTLYWHNLGGDTLYESDLAGNAQEEYIFFNGKRMARRDVTSTGGTIAMHYYFSDHLGTHSLVTDANGTMPPQSESDFYPYGGEIPITTGDSNHYKFTGKERDAESGLDYFGARHNASSLARFMSPDPKKLTGKRVLDPQQWNGFAYTRNSPLTYVDPTGKEVTTALTGQDYKNLVSALAASCTKPSFQTAFKDLKENKMVHKFGKMETEFTPSEPGSPFGKANPGKTTLIAPKDSKGNPDYSKAHTEIDVDLDRTDAAHNESHEVKHGEQVQSDPAGAAAAGKDEDSPAYKKLDKEAEDFANQVDSEKPNMSLDDATKEVEKMLPETSATKTEDIKCGGPERTADGSMRGTQPCGR